VAQRVAAVSPPSAAGDSLPSELVPCPQCLRGFVLWATAYDVGLHRRVDDGRRRWRLTLAGEKRIGEERKGLWETYVSQEVEVPTDASS
jgi:hypothetical protein